LEEGDGSVDVFGGQRVGSGDGTDEIEEDGERGHGEHPGEGDSGEDEAHCGHGAGDERAVVRVVAAVSRFREDGNEGGVGGAFAEHVAEHVGDFEGEEEGVARGDGNPEREDDIAGEAEDAADEGAAGEDRCEPRDGASGFSHGAIGSG